MVNKRPYSTDVYRTHCEKFPIYREYVPTNFQKQRTPKFRRLDQRTIDALATIGEVPTDSGVSAVFIMCMCLPLRVAHGHTPELLRRRQAVAHKYGTLAAVGRVAAILVGLQGAAAVAQPQPDQAGPALQKGQGLVPVPDARAVLAKVMPGVDWSKYRAVQIRTLQIPETVRDATPGSTTRRLWESYVLRDQDVARLQEAYASAMRDQLGAAGLAITNTSGPDTLILAAQIIDIRLAAPIESSRMTSSGGGRTYTRGAGSIAIAGVLADGQTGQVIAEMADQHNGVDVWGINNSVTNLAEARRGFNRWARALRDRLIALRQGSGAQGPKSN